MCIHCFAVLKKAFCSGLKYLVSMRHPLSDFRTFCKTEFMFINVFIPYNFVVKYFPQLSLYPLIITSCPKENQSQNYLRFCLQENFCKILCLIDPVNVLKLLHTKLVLHSYRFPPPLSITSLTVLQTPVSFFCSLL